MDVRSYRTIVGAVILIAAGMICGFVIFSKPSNQTPDPVAGIHALINQGQCAQAVATAQQVASSTPVGQDGSAIEYALANALMCRAQPGDFQTAIDAYKAVATDPSADPAVRANAYDHLAGTYYDIIGLRIAAMKNSVFNTAPFSGYLQQSNGDMTQATIALFEEGVKLNPTAFADYSIAVLQALALHQKGTDVKDPAQVALAQEIEGEIAAGDELFAATTSPALLRQTWQVFIPKALAIGTASYYLPQISSSTVSGAYAQALASIAASGSNSKIMQERLILLKFSYAAVLSGNDWAASTQLHDLLSDFNFAPGTFPAIDTAIGSVLRRTKSDFTLRQFPALATAAPSFGAYVDQLTKKR